ncbi:hypothetical protein CkaCkLH20_10979 [Colletotrichum karsti]|uniref:Uncharacterized protein n=1 Tax=Colletotrichum karsti TaxID=1095194 RepID=A0A9P6HUP7_9PEZI|nr:uncharacterized protein CkaCkLH20_10979 [Colletotrichum karsti]KAF9871568.1 hypothetical protein CkaCkLH20_10979 [Colletotrichum karsti]
MATAVLEHPRFFPSRPDALNLEDFETASIRSAAPSYFSDAPSYHSTAPNPEPIPAYSPPANSAAANRNGSTQYPTSLLPAAPAPTRSGTTTPQPRSGLPPIPPVAAATPQLNQFRIPTWSTVHSNPTINNVARRRMNQSSPDHVAHLRRFMSERMAEEEAAQRAREFRPLEDPYLVGEEAAGRARQERLARETGEDILWDEDRRWNRFLAQMQTWEGRERSPWRNVRQTEQPSQRKKLTRRLAGRLW